MTPEQPLITPYFLGCLRESPSLSGAADFSIFSGVLSPKRTSEYATSTMTFYDRAFGDVRCAMDTSSSISQCNAREICILAHNNSSAAYNQPPNPTSFPLPAPANDRSISKDVCLPVMETTTTTINHKPVTQPFHAPVPFSATTKLPPTTTDSTANTRPPPKSTRAVQLVPKKPRKREKDKLQALRNQLDSMVQTTKELNLSNQHLTIKKTVLHQLIKCLEILETMERKAAEDVAAFRADPSKPQKGAARLMDMSAEQFIGRHKACVTHAAQWATLADDDLTAEQRGYLTASVTKRTMETATAMFLKPSLLDEVATAMMVEFPDGADEEEHWLNVVRLMELSEAQVEELVCAHEVFAAILPRMGDERKALGSAIMPPGEGGGRTVPRAQVATLGGGVGSLCGEEDAEAVVAQISQVVGRTIRLTNLMCMYVFLEVLSPLQVLKCSLHAYPLIPSKAVLLHAVATFAAQRSCQADSNQSPSASS